MNFGHKFVHIPEHYLREFDRLLMGGIWAQIDLRHQYDEEASGKRSPFWIDGLKLRSSLRHSTSKSIGRAVVSSLRTNGSTC